MSFYEIQEGVVGMSEEIKQKNNAEDSNTSGAGGVVAGSIFALLLYGIFGSGMLSSTNLVLDIVYVIIGIALVTMLLMGVYGLVFKSNERFEGATIENIESTYVELNKNYKILRNQVQAGFLFSITALFIGLLIIAYSIVMVYSGFNINNLYIISGVIVEFVSATFFIVYKINFNRLNTISDELFKMWKVIIALKEIDSIDKSDKTELTKVLVERLIQ